MESPSTVTSAVAVAATAPSQQQGPGVFRFLDLPKELRLIVYDYVFDIPLAVDITAAMAAAPTPSTLLVCKQLNQETQHRYHQASRSFWTKTEFMLNLVPNDKPHKSILTALHGLSESGLDHVPHISIITTKPDREGHPLIFDLTRVPHITYMIPWNLTPRSTDPDDDGDNDVLIDTKIFLGYVNGMRLTIYDGRRDEEMKMASLLLSLEAQCKILRDRARLCVPQVLSIAEHKELSTCERMMAKLLPLTASRAGRKKEDLETIAKILLKGQMDGGGFGFMR